MNTSVLKPQLNLMGFHFPQTAIQEQWRIALKIEADSNTFNGSTWLSISPGYLHTVTHNTPGRANASDSIRLKLRWVLTHRTNPVDLDLMMDLEIPADVEPGSQELAVILDDIFANLQTYFESLQTRLVEAIL